MSYPPSPPQKPSSTQPSARGHHRPGAASVPRNGVGAAAAAIGGIGVVCALIPPVTSMGGMLGIVAVVVAVVAIVRVVLRKATNMVVSIAAFTLGIVAVVTATIMSQIMG